MCYIYTQPKKDNDIKCKGDCMVRALTIASGRPYSEVHKIMYANGWRASRGRSKTRWEYQVIKSMNDLGFDLHKHSYPAVKGVKRMTARQLSKEHPNKIFILNQANHLACLDNGKLKDTWDSSRRCVYYAWEVKHN